MSWVVEVEGWQFVWAIVVGSLLAIVAAAATNCLGTRRLIAL